MNWRPLLTNIERLKLCLNSAPTREAARKAFDHFIAGNPGDDEAELGSLYYSWALYRLEGAL
jgi:hypothetical protein